MVFAVHESFLWIKDLCQPDPWILPILSGIATFFLFLNVTAEPARTAGFKYGHGNDEIYIPYHDSLVRKIISSRPCNLLVYQ